MESTCSHSSASSRCSPQRASLRLPIVIFSTLRQPTGVSQRLPQQKVDLSIDAAQVVPSPSSQGVEHLGLGAQQERLALAHV